MTTRGIQFLKQKKIPHSVVKYQHAHKGAEYAAQAVGFPLSQTIKTLVVRIGDGRHVLVLMPGDRQVSMKRVAKALGSKKADMADGGDAQRLTGYMVGGISPFGTKKRLPVLIDTRLLSHEQVMINAGQRGVMVQLSTEDLVKTLDAVDAVLN